ncbi:hypothetical protein [Methylibium petroleiphilum]|uniref:hypothetical protein n=1 Tax=Methylibium petroleiphilum TaxID=105560 RepID=UPI000325CF04|nr:hypothetical protein [Methylibium petroleiphilum]
MSDAPSSGSSPAGFALGFFCGALVALIPFAQQFAIHSDLAAYGVLCAVIAPATGALGSAMLG